MLWDGLGFFGTSHSKLGRLKGEKVDFKTKFTSIEYVMSLVILITIVLIVIFSFFSEIGHVKSQSVTLLDHQTYEYEAKEHLPLHSVEWFNID